MAATNMSFAVTARSAAVPDIAIVIVSHNDGRWLQSCLDSIFAHAGGARVEVIVVSNASTDDTCSVVESYPAPVRLIRSTNDGFGHGNNRGLELSRARYVLFLNPDTEILAGTLDGLVRRCDGLPEVGLVGVRQVAADGALWLTIRRFPSPGRALGEALWSERWPVHPRWAGERVLDRLSYERDAECDWTSGSFMLVRREALLSAGAFDERFFLYCEEPDLCLRLKQAGWSVRHTPAMTILHHAGKGGVAPRLAAQEAFARRQYAHKHLPRSRRSLFLIFTALRHALRAAVGHGPRSQPAVRRRASLLALRTVIGRGDPPFMQPPATAVRSSTGPEHHPVPVSVPSVTGRKSAPRVTV